MDQQQNQTIFDPPKVVAVGIAAPLASLLTSRFGIAGTLLGLAISSVILTVLVDALKVYLARASTKVVKVPSGLRTEISHKGSRGRLRALLSKVLSFPARAISPKRRHSILVGSLIAAGVSFLVGLVIVTGVEASVGKSLSCLVWNNCPLESSTTGDGSTSATSTLPSIFGGGQGTISSTLQGTPSSPQQQLRGSSSPGTSQAPSQTPVGPGAETPTPASPSPQPGQRQGPSDPIEEGQQQSSSNSSGQDQQQSSSDPSSQDQQQQSLSNDTRDSSSSKDQSSRSSTNSSPTSSQKSSWHEVFQVPWTT